MAVTSWIRRQFKDGVITTGTLASGMSSGAASFTLGSGLGTTFPDGSVGPFIVTIDQGQAAEEKVLVQSRSGDVFTVATSGRGYNGTTAQAHNSNAVVLHTIDAQDLDEANQVAVATLGAVTASGDLLQGSGVNGLQRLARGASGQVLTAGASLLSWAAAPVTSVFGHTGVVVAETGDYTAAQVTNAADLSSASQQVFTSSVRASALSTAGGGTISSFTGSFFVDSSANVKGLSFLPTGLTGVGVGAARFVGGTASGAPVSGTFALGDFIIDQTGSFWICTVAGTPGTWTQVGGASDTAWTNVSAFTNSWGAGSNAPGFIKLGNVVWLRGNLTAGTANTAAFTLPAGYRPSLATSFWPVINTGTTLNRIEVDSSGAVIPLNSVVTRLEGVSFPVI